MLAFPVFHLGAVATIAWMARGLARGPAVGGGATALLVLALVGGGGDARGEEPTDPRVSSALAEARVAVAELTGRIKGLLMQELKTGGFEGAVAVCARTASDATAEYRRTFGNEIRRVSLRYRNPKNAPDDYERGVLAAFDGLSVEARPQAEHWAVVVEDGRESLRYLKPLVATPLCLTCHGDPARIPPAVREAIAREYPDDRATGFAVGDVRGAVTIRIPLVPAP